MNLSQLHHAFVESFGRPPTLVVRAPGRVNLLGEHVDYNDGPVLPAHIEFVLFGWTAQLIMGMAFWILPRFPKPPLRGNEQLAWRAFLALNAGVALIALVWFGLPLAHPVGPGSRGAGSDLVCAARLAAGESGINR